MPEGDVKGECKSACASIHTTPNTLFGWAALIPLIVPNADEWSPDKTIGKYLLDYMYDEYYKVNDSPILFIGHPATPKLIPYYIMWKTPIMSRDFLYLTSGNLLYGNKKSKTSESPFLESNRTTISS